MIAKKEVHSSEKYKVNIKVFSKLGIGHYLLIIKKDPDKV